MGLHPLPGNTQRGLWVQPKVVARTTRTGRFPGLHPGLFGLDLFGVREMDSRFRGKDTTHNRGRLCYIYKGHDMSCPYKAGRSDTRDGCAKITPGMKPGSFMRWRE
jgi:hypothetical protein